jgi:NADH dehydrogenase/NADH:ubiquinone oxidoreductase subunit G
MVNLKINDISVSVEDDVTILDAAKKLRINIPTLCYLKDINKNASCRMCVVEVKGFKGLLTSCSTKVSENMEVFTIQKK